METVIGIVEYFLLVRSSVLLFGGGSYDFKLFGVVESCGLLK